MNRSILIVMCDFLVSAMLSMLIGMSPHGQSGHMGKGALLDRGSTAIILDELRRRGAELENMREQLREAQAREGFSEAREAQLKALAEQLAETLAKSELLEDKLKLHPENAGALTPQALQQKLEEEIRKRTLAGVQRKEAEAELERMRNSLQSVSGNLATLNTNYAVSQQQLADARKAIEEREQKLENTGGELTRTREELAAQRNELANVRSTLESELARLAEVRTRAQALESNLSFTRGRLSAAERELAEARSAAEQNRKLAARREMEVRDTQRQLADARKAMLKAVNDYSRVKSELDRSKEAISAAADARAEAERNLAAKQGEADTALARLEATKKELQAAEEKLRSDVLERYDASVIRLTFVLNEKRLLLDQKGGGVFYLPLVNIAGKTVMPGFHKQLFGDAEYALNFDRVDRLEYRVNVTSAPLEEAGNAAARPAAAFPGRAAFGGDRIQRARPQAAGGADDRCAEAARARRSLFVQAGYVRQGVRADQRPLLARSRFRRSAALYSQHRARFRQRTARRAGGFHHHEAGRFRRHRHRNREFRHGPPAGGEMLRASGGLQVGRGENHPAGKSGECRIL